MVTAQGWPDAIAQMAQGRDEKVLPSSCALQLLVQGLWAQAGITADMELSSRRESVVQRRAAAAVNAAVAAECADDLMQRMLDEATGSRTHGAGPKALEPKANRSGGGMLDPLGPVGPPLSFSPGEPPMLVGEPKGAENFEVKQKVGKTPGVKRVVVPEQQSGNTKWRGWVDHRTSARKRE